MLHTRQRRRFWFGLVATLLILLGGGLVASPEFRALAQDILDLIVPGDDDTATFEFYPASGDNPEPAPTEVPSSLADLIAIVPFEVAIPTYIPDGYVYERADYSAESHSTFISYRCGLWGVGIQQRQLTDGEAPQAMEVGASATIEAVDINGTSGQYVRGEWVATSASHSLPTPAQPGSAIPYQAEWQDDSEWQKLVWVDGDFAYTVLTSSGLAAETATTCALDKDDYIAIARGLRPGGLDDAANLSAEVIPLPVLTELRLFQRADSDSIIQTFPEATTNQTAVTSWDEALRLTGFDLPQPVLPAGFVDLPIYIDADTPMLSTTYTHRLGSGDTAVQSVFLNVRELGVYPPYDPLLRWVGQSVVAHAVQIGGIPGEYVRGMWQAQYDMTNAEPGQTFAPTPGVPLEMRWESDVAYSQLRWQQGGIVLTLAAGGRPGETVTLDELVSIAESLAVR